MVLKAGQQRGLAVESSGFFMHHKRLKISYGMKKMGIRWIKAIMATSGLLAAITIHAQALFTIPQDFKINKSCTAYDSIKKENNPVSLQVGKSYLSFGENKAEGASHAYIEIEGKKKWVKLECGSYLNSKPDFKIPHQTTSANPAGKKSSACLKFFDNDTNPIKTGNGFKDITPLAPPLDKFDQDVLHFCGAPGKATSAEGFKSLMKANPDVLKNLFAFTGGKVFQQKSKNTNINTYLDDLANAWYLLHAFDHIFCGEKSGRSIGGLHFHGRYQQLESNKQLCRMNNFKSNEVIEGSVYSMGVEMKLADGDIIRHSIKGYGLTLSASDILLSATKAFSENHTSSNKSEHCILTLKDANVSYAMVFVRRNNGIRTYYPDATPDNSKLCSKPVSL